jgi:hypothetical protein
LWVGQAIEHLRPRPYLWFGLLTIKRQGCQLVPSS